MLLWNICVGVFLAVMPCTIGTKTEACSCYLGEGESLVQLLGRPVAIWVTGIIWYSYWGAVAIWATGFIWHSYWDVLLISG